MCLNEVLFSGVLLLFVFENVVIGDIVVLLNFLLLLNFFGVSFTFWSSS